MSRIQPHFYGWSTQRGSKFGKRSLNYSGLFEDTIILHFNRYTLPHLDDGLKWRMEDNLSRRSNGFPPSAMYILGIIKDNLKKSFKKRKRFFKAEMYLQHKAVILFQNKNNLQKQL